ncbi:transglycosylase domain-containing protein [Amedibacillus sp. YH-ame6]
MNLKEKITREKTGDKKEKKTTKKGKKAKTKRSILDRVVIVFLAFALLVGVGGISLIGYIIATTNASDLVGQMSNDEPSSFLDQNKEEYGELGLESRENVSYEQIPGVVVDAFLAIEDSRFFSHNGFDLPRFMSSALTNLKTGSFAQGGSTLTMQAIDNFFMKKEEDKMRENGEHFNSVEKVERKLQEIYMSMRLESQTSKTWIMESYLNRINFGDQARGIEKGAQYFFGKSVEELNLSEAAYLAGCINAPNTYNPYNGYDAKTKVNYYAAAAQRRDETLAMMLRHGFITQEEHDLAKSTKLALQVVGKDNGTEDPFKKYMDAAAQEVYQYTGKKYDPATTPMIVYTNLNREAQLAANEIADGKVVDLYDDYLQIGFSVINAKTGGIEAFCPGRSDYVEEFYRNRSNLVERLPGSSIKPLIDYAYALDYTGFCTSRVFNDKPMDLDGTPVRNSDQQFYGKVSMERTIAQSLNTSAVQTLKASIDMNGIEHMQDYLRKLGFEERDVEAFNLRYSLGGSISTSPQQMAAAYAALANGGTYNEPRLVTRIEFKDGKTPAIDFEKKQTQPLSPQAAYMMSDLLYKAVNGEHKGWNLMGRLGFGAYPVYGKTGTSDWASDGLQYGIPETAMKDEWMINYTSEYVIATWTGYDSQYQELGYYPSTDLLFKNIPGWINKYMLDKISKNPQFITNPGGISSYGGGMIKDEWLRDAAKNNPMTIQNSKSAMDGLQALYDKVKDLAADGYTADSYAKLKSILEKVKKLLDKDLADDEDIKNAMSELQGAYDALVPNVNKNTLIDAINHAASLNASLYTPESYNHLKSVVDNAKGTLNKEKVTQAELDAKIAEIQNAINALVTPAPVVDKTDLSNTIATATAKLNSITPDNPNYAPLKAAIDAATATLNNANATQADVNAQAAALKNAMNAF